MEGRAGGEVGYIGQMGYMSYMSYIRRAAPGKAEGGIMNEEVGGQPGGANTPAMNFWGCSRQSSRICFARRNSAGPIGG